MVKTAIFLGGFACGVAVSSAMTDEQRRMIAGRLRAPMASGTRQPSRSVDSPAPTADVGPFTNGNGAVERQSAAVPTPS